ncbi:ribonuclease H-like domain-containing protein [Chiua virens]|nr:ribonuclease H-like domain-containing protein [Chiua virens]
MPRSTNSSSNWLALQKTWGQDGRPRKRRKIDRDQASGPVPDRTAEFPRNTYTPCLPSKRHSLGNPNEHIDLDTTEVKNGESIAGLRRMVLGKMEYTTSQTAPGKYLALDCEMVGVGIEGNESSLARVSIVNHIGAIVLDVFVKQRERVVDYRTQWSGVRSTDLAGSAKSFKEIQQTVADLIKDRILVGHAIYNDLKALLLSHPSPQIRDTQSLAYKHRVVKSRRPALRVLAKQELGIVIQSGEHSSVTDARATMALFRLYKKQWDNGTRSFRSRSHALSQDKNGDNSGEKTLTPFQSSPSPPSNRKRKRPGTHDLSDADVEKADELSKPSRPGACSPSPSSAPRIQSLKQASSTGAKFHNSTRKARLPADSSQRKGASSGLSIVSRRAGGMKEVTRKGNRIGNDGEKNTDRSGKRWWESLGGNKKEVSRFDDETPSEFF